MDVLLMKSPPLGHQYHSNEFEWVENDFSRTRTGPYRALNRKELTEGPPSR